MSSVQRYRNVFVGLLVALALSGAGCGALWANAGRRVEREPETYGTGVVPTPEVIGMALVFLAMVVMTLAAMVVLVLWLAAWIEGRRSRRRAAPDGEPSGSTHV